MVDFNTKVKELEYIHSKIEAERKTLEARIQMKKDFQKSFYEVKAKQVQEELARLEAYRIKSKIRNDNFKQAIHTALEGDKVPGMEGPGLSYSLARGKQQLKDAKEQFVKELQRRDPDWTERLANRRHQDIERMEFDQKRMQTEIFMKQKEVKEEQLQRERARQLQLENQKAAEQLRDLEREKSKLEHQRKLAESAANSAVADRQKKELADKQREMEAFRVQAEQDRLIAEKQAEALRLEEQMRSADSQSAIKRAQLSQSYQPQISDLECAVRTGDVDAIQELSAVFGLDHRLAGGDSLLHIAVQERQADSVSYLCNNAKDISEINCVNDEGKTPLDCAQSLVNKGTWEIQNSDKVIAMLNKVNAKASNDMIQPDERHAPLESTGNSGTGRNLQNATYGKQRPENPLSEGEDIDEDFDALLTRKSGAETKSAQKNQTQPTKKVVQQVVEDSDQDAYYNEDAKGTELELSPDTVAKRTVGSEQKGAWDSTKIQPAPKEPKSEQKAGTNKAKDQRLTGAAQSNVTPIKAVDSDSDGETNQFGSGGSPLEETMGIEIVRNAIQPTVENITSQTKLMLAGVLQQYIQVKTANLINNSKRVDKPWFEKSRETDLDREMKFNLIKAFNNQDPGLTGGQSLDKQFDVGIACDLLLDLLRYEEDIILDPRKVIEKFEGVESSAQVPDQWLPENIIALVVQKDLKPVVKIIFNLITQCYSLKLNKNLDQVSLLLADAICVASAQVDQYEYQSHLAMAIKGAIQSKCDENPTFSSIKGDGKITKMQQAVVQHEEHVQSKESFGAQGKSNRTNNSSRGSKMGKNVTMTDELRIKAANEIKKVIEGGELSAAYGTGNMHKIVQQLRDDSHDLIEKVQSISHSNLVPAVDSDTPQVDYACMLLLLLKTRDTQNIEQNALLQCAESQDISEFREFFADQVKSLYDVLIRHYGVVLRKRIMKQKDAESLIMAALKNFKPRPEEDEFVRSCVVDGLCRAAAEPKANRKSSLVQQNNMEMNINTTDNSQFDTQQQYWSGAGMGKKSQLQKSSGQKIKPSASPVPEEFGADEIVGVDDLDGY